MAGGPRVCVEESFSPGSLSEEGIIARWNRIRVCVLPEPVINTEVDIFNPHLINKESLGKSLEL